VVELDAVDGLPTGKLPDYALFALLYFVEAIDYVYVSKNLLRFLLFAKGVVLSNISL